jgi:hypothetical protein
MAEEKGAKTPAVFLRQASEMRYKTQEEARLAIRSALVSVLVKVILNAKGLLK